VKDFGKTYVVIGAGLIGAYVVKELARRGDVVATVYSPREVAPFERRTKARFVEEKDGERKYKSYNGNEVSLQAGFDVFGKGSMRALLTQAQQRGDIAAVVNSVNLGTIFGLKSAGGNLGDGEVFEFCHKTNRVLTEAAERQRSPIKYVTIGTTGTGGIGIERLRISHNNDGGDSIPKPVREKARCANEILSTFRDFGQSNSRVDYIGIVPACAVVDTELFTGAVPIYGDYKNLFRSKLFRSDNGNLPLVSSRTKEVIGDFETPHFVFGEDGPHTAHDAQQLVMFMGLTHAERVAQIATDEMEGVGANNHNVLTGGTTIPASDNNLIRSMEVKCRRNGESFPTLSPIGPFDIPLFSVILDMLAKTGTKTLSDARNISSETAEKILLKYLKENEGYANKAVSLGIRFELDGSAVEGKFVRGIVSGKTIKKTASEARDFESRLRSGGMLSVFMEQYGDDPLLSDVNGYLAAYPIAKTMPKRRHLLA